MERKRHWKHGITGAGFIDLNSNDMYQCPNCEKEFKSRNGLGQHISYRHQGIKKEFYQNRIPWNKGLKGYKRGPVKKPTCFRNKCPITGIEWTADRYQKYHDSVKIKYETYRTRCKFKFNVYDYPDEFDLSLIEKFGWYSPNGFKFKNKKPNLNGVSRDHQLSIFEGFKNNINPKIMSHPANCKIVEHYKENASKGSKSSFDDEELERRIRLWNKKYGR